MGGPVIPPDYRAATKAQVVAECKRLRAEKDKLSERLRSLEASHESGIVVNKQLRATIDRIDIQRVALHNCLSSLSIRWPFLLFPRIFKSEARRLLNK